MTDFVAFPKIARLTRDCTITEKLDGTNASIWISDNARDFRVGSRTRWITPQDDNHGFARWVHLHIDELMSLGPGTHYGEWWGSGIQRGYGLEKGDKRFSLFNTARWGDDATRPACCSVVPVLYQGVFDTFHVAEAVIRLAAGGSVAAPGFQNPEGVIVYHQAANLYFKKTIHKDNEWKGKEAA